MSKIEVNTIEPQCGTTLTLGASGDTVTLGSGASQSGFGRTGTVDWDTTAKTANFNAVSGNGYFVNTTSGAVTVTLPATPSAGDIVSLADYTNTWQTNAVTVARNGSNIGGVAENASLSTEGQSVTFIYVDGTEGWKNIQDSTSNVIGESFITATGGSITCCGNFKIHTFTGPGTFTVCSVSTNSNNNIVSYIVVGGGGSGSSNDYCGPHDAMAGGGAGGFRENKSPVDTYTASPLNGSTPITVTATGYPITVGGGGSAVGANTIGNNGSVSTFSTITSAGGGKGGKSTTNGPGGSGGGGGRDSNTAGGTGNTPPVTPPQGNNGGASLSGPYGAAGGGGGAGAVGSDGSTGNSAPTEVGGNGGNGVTSSITGSPITRAGGGAAGSYCVSGTQGTGGTGGGGNGGNVASGNGSSPCNAVGGNGTTNTGSGGGGGGVPSGAGGSGIVVIRYKYR